ncbi:MAG: MFS transporter [Caldilineaceae bacterium]|nr:MFS transporter [Caldilineaceae bacterium]
MTAYRANQPTEPTTVEKLRGLPWSMAGNAANTIFVKFTFFGSTFVLLLSALGLSKSQIGILLSLIPYFGLVSLVAAPFVRRMGYKRSFLFFWAVRQAPTFGVLLAPWISLRYGVPATFIYIALMVALFALFRALGETAGMPWRQEYIPNAIRGKYAATDSMITTVVSFIAVIVASQVIAYGTGLSGYMLLFAAGGLFALGGVWFYTFIPGGAPIPKQKDEPSPLRGFGEALNDKNFRRFLIGYALVISATGPLNSLIPLYMEEQIGISTSNVILLQGATLMGTLLFSFMWGWMSDRYGSKPVMLVSILLRAMLPVLYWVMPRTEPYGLWAAMVISFLVGMTDIGWLISSGRLLFVGVVPPEKKAQYMPLYFAWIGLVGGTSQLLGGRLVDISANLSGQFLGFSLDSYTPLLLLGLVLPLFALPIFLTVRADADYGVGEFAGLFLRGNPFMAVRSLINYQFARNEEDVLEVTAQLGRSRSPLTEEELLEALYDPRYHVRLEALVSIAQMKPNQRLRQAVIEIAYGTELALSGMAIWALGRMGDPESIPALRAILSSPYRSIRAQAIRALGALGDKEMSELFLRQLRQEEDPGLQMAYASSLGRLEVDGAVDELLTLLYRFRNQGARLELAMDVARLHGDEHYYVQLTRQMRIDAGTVTAQAVDAFHKKLTKHKLLDATGEDLMAQCSGMLARENVDEGARLFGQLLEHLPLDEHLDKAGATVIRECALRLQEFGSRHLEYLALALHTIHSEWSE